LNCFSGVFREGSLAGVVQLFIQHKPGVDVRLESSVGPYRDRLRTEGAIFPANKLSVVVIVHDIICMGLITLG
jgi:hypothetical protein